MAEAGYRLGNLPDEYHPRDFSLFSAHEIQNLPLVETSTSEAASPKSFFLPDLPPVYNQLKIGSCTASAACAALRYAYRKYSGKPYEDFQPSRLFAYYYSRITRRPEDLGENETLADTDKRISQAIKMDTGSNNRRIIHTLLMEAVCVEDLWLYGSPFSDQELFDTSSVPNPCDPKDWAKVSWAAKPSSHPNDGKSLSEEPDVIPRAISYYRIYDPSVTPTLDPNTKLSLGN